MHIYYNIYLKFCQVNYTKMYKSIELNKIQPPHSGGCIKIKLIQMIDCGVFLTKDRS